MKLIYTTFPSEVLAEEMVHVLLAQKLIACANLYPGVRSFYMWEGKTCKESEVVVIMKTTEACLPALKDYYLQHHPYDCPCFLTLSVDSNQDFLEWVRVMCVQK